MHRRQPVFFDGGVMTSRAVALMKVETVVRILFCKRSQAAVAKNFGGDGSESDDRFFGIAFNDGLLMTEMSRSFETAVEKDEKIVRVEIGGETALKRSARIAGDLREAVGDAFFYTKRNAVFVN